LEGGIEIVLVAHAAGGAVESPGERDEIGIRLLIVAGAEVGVRPVAGVEAVLSLHPHAQVLIVE
jgi:hypothetical protein